MVQVGEECDDGNTDVGDGCDENCIVEVCGNGVVQVDEECDDGNTKVGDGCDETCIVEVCGNGVVQFGEVCDDGNTVGGDGCSADCTSDETCGNGIVDPGEQCDDGNDIDDDMCRNDCTEPMLLVVLDSFTAAVVDGSVRLEWTTAMELDNAGFRVLRGRVPATNDDPAKLERVELESIAGVIPARGSDLVGATYEFVDTAAPAGRLIYVLEDIDLNGEVTRHEPVFIEVAPQGRTAPRSRSVTTTNR